MLDNQTIVKKHNPIHRSIDFESPLTLGNGSFAFTADVTGLQSLNTYYSKNDVPLCTMSQWAWHSIPFNHHKAAVTYEDLEMTHYKHNDKPVIYAVDAQEGNEHVYNWLRKNPHKFNLGQIGFLWKGEALNPDDVTEINQQLDLNKGRLTSRFKIKDYAVKVITIVSPSQDTVSFKVTSKALIEDKLRVSLNFPYGSSKISASDWNSREAHQTSIISRNDRKIICRQIDDTQYSVELSSSTSLSLEKKDQHQIDLVVSEETVDVSLHFYEEDEHRIQSFETVSKQAEEWWTSYWTKSGMIDFSEATDSRAMELERRMVLSLYLVAVQSTGSIPPQETGLMVNSWYGKFHLEMHLWHIAFMLMWGHHDLILPSLRWYKKQLPKAIENAERNQYKGARWPKMIADDAIDSPSTIATLLIWQQSHIIYLLEILFSVTEEKNYLDEFWEVIEQTADFMCDFFKFDEKTGCYKLTAPIMPSQEVYNPETVENPMFELEYWRFTLGLAIKWADRLGIDKEKWVTVYNNIEESPTEDGLYIGHKYAHNMFENFNIDHPSMVGAYGLIPNERLSKKVMHETIEKILDCWDFQSMWGWDFAMMAMTFTRLNEPEKAIDILMMDTHKNYYAANGHNYQNTRTDLPAYLPGNGSLLLSLTLMASGVKESDGKPSGFPDNEKWTVYSRNISPFPY